MSAFQIKHYTNEDGLPQNSVYSIAKDEFGYIWLSTERGLARFDGIAFKVFDNFGKTYQAASIGSFHIDPRAKADGFFALNSEQNFIHIHHGRAALDTTLYRQLAAQPFPYPSRGTGYVYERSPTLFHANTFPDYFAIPAGNDRFFVYDTRNLDYYERKNKVGRISLPGKSIWDFFRVNDGLYHLEDGTLTRFAAGAGQFKGEQVHFKGDLIHDRSYKRESPLEIFWNNATNQTFVVVGQSLYHITPTANGNLTSELIMRGFDFQKEQIKAVYYDQKAGRIFLGSQLSGVWVLTRKKFLPLATDFPGTDQVYYGQALTGTGVLSAQGIAYSQEGPEGKILARQLPLVTKSVFWDKYSILVDHQGYIWCKQGPRLTVIKPDGSGIRFSWELPGRTSQLYQGRDKTIWIGTLDGGLLYVKAPFTNRTAPTLFSKEPLNDISWITEQGPDSIWVGTRKGLFRVSRHTKAVSSIKGLENAYIRSMLISRDKSETWITTYKDGFFLLKKGKLTRFPLDTKGYLASAHCIIEDGKGFLWITTNQGIFQVLLSDLLAYSEKPRELYYHRYAKTDGFNTNEFNGGCQPCAVRLPSGYVSLPSINGLIWFKPEMTTAEVPANSIMVDRIDIDGKPTPAKQKQVVFSQDQKQLALQVNTPFLGNPDNLAFSYTLQKEGKTPKASDWLRIETTAGNVATITISTLSQGHYVLNVRKANGFGEANYSYETIRITVPPFWYQTWWFYSSVFLALILSFLFYSKYRIRAIKRRNLLLEMQVSERTSQLQLTLRDLEKSQEELLNQMHLQSRFMASIAHDVRSPLGAVIIVSDEMQKMVDQQQYNEVSLFVKNIADTIRRVKDSLEDMLAYVKIQVYKHEPKNERILLYNLIEENMQLYGKNTKINSNTFLNLIPADVVVVTNAQLLKIIVHNLMDNANKYTDNGEIRAYTLQDTNRLSLVIEDNGQGISQDLVEWFTSGKPLSAPSSNGGIGLAMVRELAAAVAESIRIERLNQGTKIIITFHN
ncbi:sensor histidine kinase [Dyadobacter alkalitolerans]|uniref:sensor histidine kinase n=1 Tax=Dyadobacter alkalitolerans TaxID=492736 RepID=UPI00146F9677|nr:two-component regulator propeller domain-containing protein [Dyadobacter alkalitolerans]